jgi:hypothetical protein
MSDDDRPDTHTLSDEELAAVKRQSALPFADGPDDDELPGTLTLSDADQAELAKARGAAPFPIAAPASPDTVAAAKTATPWSAKFEPLAIPTDAERTATLDIPAAKPRGAAAMLEVSARAELVKLRVAAAAALPKDTYAAIKAAQRTSPASLPELLAEQGIDAAAWGSAERAWSKALAREAELGHKELASALDVAIAKAHLSSKS